jgi:hypothetical protein
LKKKDLFSYINKRRYAVEATVGTSRRPQAAVVGIAVTPALEIVFDTLKTTRKYRNLKRNPRIAFVIGWDEDSTLQYEGIVRELGPKDGKHRAAYLRKFPDGKERLKWPGITHFLAAPQWIRLTKYSKSGETVQEFEF